MFDSDKVNHKFSFTQSELSQSSQQAYDIVYQEAFGLEQKEGINLLITATSDFLRLDISFVLVNTKTSHMYSPQSYSEDKKKLLVQNVPEGKYKLYVYTRKLDKKTQGKIPLVSRFKMTMNLYSFEDEQKTFVKVVPDSGTGWKKIEVA